MIEIKPALTAVKNKKLNPGFQPQDAYTSFLCAKRPFLGQVRGTSSNSAYNSSISGFTGACGSGSGSGSGRRVEKYILPN